MKKKVIHFMPVHAFGTTVSSDLIIQEKFYSKHFKQ